MISNTFRACMWAILAAVFSPQTLAQLSELGPQQTAVSRFISANQQRLFADPDSPRLGPKNARLTLVAFTDYNCPFCKIYDPILEKVVHRHPDVAVVIKLLPVIAPGSLPSAQLALTLWRKDPAKFWVLHHLFMAKKGHLDEQSMALARSKAQVILGAGDEISLAQVADNVRLAQGLGVRGTPATLIGDILVPGSVPEQHLEEAIKLMLEQNPS